MLLQKLCKLIEDEFWFSRSAEKSSSLLYILTERILTRNITTEYKLNKMFSVFSITPKTILLDENKLNIWLFKNGYVFYDSEEDERAKNFSGRDGFFINEKGKIDYLSSRRKEDRKTRLLLASGGR